MLLNPLIQLLEMVETRHSNKLFIMTLTLIQGHDKQADSGFSALIKTVVKICCLLTHSNGPLL